MGGAVEHVRQYIICSYKCTSLKAQESAWRTGKMSKICHGMGLMVAR